MSTYAPVLHALTIEPRVARPGEPVRLRFRATNHGATPTARAVVRFVLDPALEPLGETQLEIDEVAPGGELVAETCARIAASADDGMRLGAQAVMLLAGDELGSNRCDVLVRGRAVLDGPASGTFVEMLDAETVLVRAVVCNEGDATARGVRVVLPAPSGCTPVEADAACEQRIERLGPGESAELAFAARIAAPAREIAADDAEVCASDRVSRALHVRSAVTPSPAIVPALTLDVARRLVRIAVEVRNDGWVEASGVRVEMTFPPGFRFDDATVAVDGVPADRTTRRARGRAGRHQPPPGWGGHDEPYARVERASAGPAVVLGRVPARQSRCIEMLATYGAECEKGAVRALAGERAAEAAFAPAFVSDVRIEAVDAPPRCAPGEEAAIGVRVLNAGDRAEHVSILVAGAGTPIAGGDGSAPSGGDDVSTPSADCDRSERVPLGTIAPGWTAHAWVRVRVSDDARDGDVLRYRISASGEGGTPSEREIALVVHDRPRIVVDEPPAGVGDRVRYVLRNVGSSTARDVVASVAGDRYVLGTIAPGAVREIEAAAGAARAGGAVTARGLARVALPPQDQAVLGGLTIRVETPATVVAGAPFAATIDVVADDRLDELALTLLLPDGLSCVAGSTTVDGHALLDREGESPLVRGLSLYGIPPATRVALACSVLAAATLGGETRALGVAVSTSEERSEAAGGAIAFVARDSFAIRPAGLPYHVDACTLPPRGAPSADETADAAPLVSAVAVACSEAIAAGLPQLAPFGAIVADRSSAFTFAVRFAGERASVLARLLRGENARLVDHVLVLRALVPDLETSGDGAVTAALNETAAALADVFDRAFVKLRIPAFAVAATDLEDAALRGALIRLLESLQDTVPGDAAAPAHASATLPAGSVRGLLASFADAPYGDPAMLRAVVALVPTCCPDDARLERALAAYVRAVDGALARYDGAPRGTFDAALGRRAGDELDAARAALTDAVRERAAELAPC